jgi:SNF2 family DNA or RNA helicase
MEIVDNKFLVVRTREPQRILQAIKKSATYGEDGDVTEVAVNWDLPESQALSTLGIKSVPSPINKNYNWPGVHPPMKHQAETSSFLTLRKRAFCFNEQGTGKTASAIWAADYLIVNKYIRRVLVVCPLSIMQSAWQSDLFKFAVHRTVGVAYGDRRRRESIVRGPYEFVIINYDGVAIVEDEIRNGDFGLVIIDEANAYKNARTDRFKVMRRIVTQDTWLWMMTGTPAAQSPLDAYGLAKLCVPDRTPYLYGAYRDSVMYQLSRFKWIPKPTAETTVYNMLQPAIRFEKSACLDLPPVTHTSRFAPLTAQQTKYYAKLKKDMIMEAAGEEVTSVNAAANLNKLLQVSCGAIYTDTGGVIDFDASNRLQALIEVIEEASHKVLIYVPFTHAIEKVQGFLTKNKIASEVINGAVSVTKRTDIFKRFQETDNPQVLVIQPQAASHGVTLTAANVIIWYAPVTSSETYMQANARIDRPGQYNPMTIVHIEGSPVESKLYAALEQKLDFHTRIVDLYKNEMTS